MRRDDDLEELDGLVDLYDQYKRGKAARSRQEREDEQDLRHREQQLRQELELDRLQRLSGLSLEVLVLAADSPEKALLLASLARTKVLSGLPPEKIAVLLAEQSPQVAAALGEVLRGVNAAGDVRTLAMYEKLLEELKQQSHRTREDYQTTLRTFTQMFERFADTTVEVARAAAGSSAAGRTCPNGHPVSVEARFCEQCGAPLVG
jgi:hypothetical protein